MAPLRHLLRVLLLLVGLTLPLPLPANPPSPLQREPVGVVPATEEKAPEGTWTLVVLPDTQYYSSTFPEVFVRQTEWIAKHRDPLRILCVAHEGDITNNNLPKQWETAQTAMRRLNAAKIPYVLVPGNHDLGNRGKTDTHSTLLNDYFKESDYENSGAYGLFEPGRLENSWHEISTPTGKFLVVGLEFGPRDEVLEWANKVIAEHPTHATIIVTHAYLKGSGERDRMIDRKRTAGNPKAYPYAKEENVNDGQDIWEKLVSKQPNIILVLSGHFTGRGGKAHRVDLGADGQKVHQLFANFQDSGKTKGVVKPGRGYGGGGYLRLLRFSRDKVEVKTYSPWYDHWLNEPGHELVLELSPVGQ